MQLALPRPKQLQEKRTCRIDTKKICIYLRSDTLAPLFIILLIYSERDAKDVPVLHELQDGRSLSGGGVAGDDDAAVGGQVRGEVLGNLAVEPLAAHESGARFAGRDLEEKRLERPVQLAVVGEGA